MNSYLMSEPQVQLTGRKVAVKKKCEYCRSMRALFFGSESTFTFGQMRAPSNLPKRLQALSITKLVWEQQVAKNNSSEASVTFLAFANKAESGCTSTQATVGVLGIRLLHS